MYLALIGSLGGYPAYLYALRHLPVSTVGMYAYINPLIAVLLGSAVLGEPLNSRIALACAIVFAGIAVTTRRAH
jgi:drug/metabolite transporter (DMT)-like permease